MTWRSASSWLSFAALFMSVSASAHPIEPLVTGSPMPVPRDWIGVDIGYSLLRESAHTSQRLPVTVSAGIGGYAEIFAGASFDPAESLVGPALVGGKVLLLMEGPRGIDLALAGTFSSARAFHGVLLLGRTLRPGLSLQGALGGEIATPTESTAAHTHALTLVPHHSGDVTVAETETRAFRAAAALQWAARPRLLPTLEAQVMHFFEPGPVTETWIVPELIYLLEINHASIKLAMPIGLSGGTDIGLLAAVNWQR